MKHLMDLGIMCLCLLLLNGCTFTPPITVKLKSAEILNLDSENISLPVIVRIYQLSDSDKFEQSNFVDLWKKETECFGGHLLARKELTIPPSSETKIKLDRNEKAKYLAIIATFRNPEGNHWRALKKISVGILPRTVNGWLKGNILEIK